MGIKWDGKNFKEFVEDRSQIIQKIGLPRILLIIIAGIVLVVASVTDKKGNNDVYEDDVYTSGGGDNNINGSYNYSSESAALNAMAEYASREEGKLERILGQVEGIGKVKVMITLASSEERMTLQDTDNTESSTDEQDSNGGSRQQEEYILKSENVIISSEGNEYPYVVQVNSPKIEGVAVVAEGAGSGKKDSEIIDAVVALFSIEPHKIKVMKME
jgi:hypothetical protein